MDRAQKREQVADLKQTLNDTNVVVVTRNLGLSVARIQVRVKNTRMLEGFLAKVIKAVPGIERTETVIVLSSTKETMQIPTREPDWMEK